MFPVADEQHRSDEYEDESYCNSDTYDGTLSDAFVVDRLRAIGIITRICDYERSGGKEIASNANIGAGWWLLNTPSL